MVLADDVRLIARNGNIVTGQKDFETTSWTIGGNWAISDNLAVYARWTDAEDMGYANEFSYFSIPSFGAPPGSNMGLTDTPTELEFAELGVRYIGNTFSGFVTYFDATHLNSGSIFVDDTTGAVLAVLADTEASGLEFWLDWSLGEVFSVNLSGVLMENERAARAGNAAGLPTTATPIARVPETQIRVAPTLDFGRTRVFLSANHYSKRYSDRAVTRDLPAYTTISLGASFDVTDALTVSLLGKNVTDEWGFTSGNFREPPVQGPSPVGYNSTIPGATWMVTADYHF